MKSARKMSNKSPFLRVLPAALVALALGLGSLAAHADQAVVVPGTSDIWLAGQPNGSSVTGYFGSDFAPGNSPIGVGIVGGDTYTFSITGYTPVSVDGSCFDSNADAGVCYPDEFGFSPGPANGISLAHLPADALVGVFVPAGGPSGPTPAPLDFTASGIGTSFASLSPALDQLFFIGDGLTGTGTGSVQDFIAPAGAGTLYLATGDSVGASYNNSGSISANVIGNTVNTVTPEPDTLVLLGSGLVGLAGMVRRKLRMRA
jgi:hypothetical protein